MKRARQHSQTTTTTYQTIRELQWQRRHFGAKHRGGINSLKASVDEPFFAWVKRGLVHNIYFSAAALLGNLQPTVFARKLRSIEFVRYKYCEVSSVITSIVWETDIPQRAFAWALQSIWAKARATRKGTLIKTSQWREDIFVHVCAWVFVNSSSAVIRHLACQVNSDKSKPNS